MRHARPIPVVSVSGAYAYTHCQSWFWQNQVTGAAWLVAGGLHVVPPTSNIYFWSGVRSATCIPMGDSPKTGTGALKVAAKWQHRNYLTQIFASGRIIKPLYLLPKTDGAPGRT